jgi:ribonucleoside-triphosphate reductase
VLSERMLTSFLLYLITSAILDIVIKVGDSKPGWAKAFTRTHSASLCWYNSSWDISGVRPAGSRLKVMGGRASVDHNLLLTCLTSVLKYSRRLQDVVCILLNATTLMCKVGEIVVVGGFVALP